MNKQISIIIPVYNESERIVKNINLINDYAKAQNYDHEIIAVDDGSKDNSLKLLHEESSNSGNLMVLGSEHRGKGHAIKKGILASSGKIICIIDADLSIDPSYIDIFIKEIQSGSDIIIASRIISKNSIVNTPKIRKAMTAGFRFIRRLILGMRIIQDTQCGLKVFNGNKIRNIIIQSKINGFCFDAELLFIALKNNLSIKELPVNIALTGKTSIKIFKDSVLMATDLLRIQFYNLTGKYN